MQNIWSTYRILGGFLKIFFQKVLLKCTFWFIVNKSCFVWRRFWVWSSKMFPSEQKQPVSMSFLQYFLQYIIRVKNMENICTLFYVITYLSKYILKNYEKCVEYRKFLSLLLFSSEVKKCKQSLQFKSEVRIYNLFLFVS